MRSLAVETRFGGMQKEPQETSLATVQASITSNSHWIDMAWPQIGFGGGRIRAGLFQQLQ